MRTIYLETIIHAPIEKVFDLARSIDAHIQTTGNTHERVVAGKLSGLVELKIAQYFFDKTMSSSFLSFMTSVVARYYSNIVPTQLKDSN